MPQKQHRKQQPRGMSYRGLGTAITKKKDGKNNSDGEKRGDLSGLGGYGSNVRVRVRSTSDNDQKRHFVPQ